MLQTTKLVLVRRRRVVRIAWMVKPFPAKLMMTRVMRSEHLTTTGSLFAVAAATLVMLGLRDSDSVFQESWQRWGAELPVSRLLLHESVPSVPFILEWNSDIYETSGFTWQINGTSEFTWHIKSTNPSKLCIHSQMISSIICKIDVSKQTFSPSRRRIFGPSIWPPNLT